MTKIEEVADGLAAKFKETIAASAGVPFEQTGVTLPGRHIWLAYARAAIEAMREPSEGMQKAFDTSGAAYDSGYCDFDDFEQSWNAAIDYALAP